MYICIFIYSFIRFICYIYLFMCTFMCIFISLFTNTGTHTYRQPSPSKTDGGCADYVGRHGVTERVLLAEVCEAVGPWVSWFEHVHSASI